LRAPCLGQCDRGPAAMLTIAGESPTEDVLAPASVEAAVAALGGERPEPVADPQVRQAGEPGLQLLGRVGLVDPRSLHDYRAAGGYEALRSAIEMGASRVIREVKDSGLMGRGGAAFPTGVKWEAVAQQPVRPHYLICNADESEPGTFKDRVIMESDPFSLIESMTIAAYATGCEYGYLYLRGEYPLAQRRLEHAVEQARERGYLGDDVLGHGFKFDIELRKGAGAYICGEETAVFGSIEGLRGEPRNKPPFPVERGLFGQPTVVNNVETLVNVLPIVLEGGPAFAAIGTERSTGPKLFCVSGAVVQPGTYEVPFGTTLRELLELAGGLKPGVTLGAVLLGGAAGSFVTRDYLDLKLTFEGAREVHTTLGSGVVLVLDETADVPELLMTIAGFMRDESCGQCVPCRVGTVRQEEALARLISGQTRGTVQDELKLIAEIGQAMRDASICGLGQTASSAVESAIARLGVFAHDGNPGATT
ncbi:MAG TPA: NADH-ubiquinone oxidoreductase-F iron-sulfur binding region domain-containing protein, partial [Solirubrobacteraceae bacterium]